MKTIITLLLFAMLFAACRTPTHTQSTEKIVVRDSIVERVRDTTIYIPVEKVVVQNVAIIPDSSFLENKYATSRAYVHDNLLFHNLIQKEQSMPITIKYVDKFHTVVRDSTVFKTDTVEVNRLTRLQSFRLVLGDIFAVLLVIALGYLAFKIYKI